MILEQGLTLDELVGMKASLEREAQQESGGERSPPTTGAAGRDAVPHYRRSSPMVRAWLHAGRVMLLRKLGSTAAPKVLRRENSLGQETWWGATAPHRWRSREECCATIVAPLRW